MSNDDVREIVEIDKIWAAWKGPPEFVRKIGIFLVVLIFSLLIFMYAALFLLLIGGALYSLWTIINAQMSGEYIGIFPYMLLLVTLVGLFMYFLFSLNILKTIIDPKDLRYLVRFKILPPEGIESSSYHFDPIDPIEAVLLILKGKERWYSRRRYKRDSPDSNQLDFIQIYLQKKYQRYVSEDECLRFFAMGIMQISKAGRRRPVEVNYSFVMLDEKTGELLFYTDEQNEWSYIRKVLGESGLFLFDINETVVDMKKYVINEDGSITKKLTSPRLSGTNKIKEERKGHDY